MKRYLLLGLLLASSTGCQTWPYETGMTLPSGHYLEHFPQYIPRTPPFPLRRELAIMQEQGQAAGPIPRGQLPPPLVGGGP